MTGKVHSFETLGTLDGPGVRVVVFLAGCPLRCLYCHNPDTWDKSAGTNMTPTQVFEKVRRFMPYFRQHGGITLSGGEPLLQPEFAREIMELCRASDISTCVDTSGSVFNDEVKKALALADLVILDVKHTDCVKYYRLTGGDQEIHRLFLEHCKKQRIPLWVRQVVLPGWNDTPEDMDKLLRYVDGADVRKIELLPYHTMGVSKWRALGLPYALEEVKPPSDALMDALRAQIAKGFAGGSDKLI